MPSENRGKRDPAQVFHEALRYWWQRCGEEDADLDFLSTAQEYIDTVLSTVPEERTVEVVSEREAEALETTPGTDL